MTSSVLKFKWGQKLQNKFSCFLLNSQCFAMFLKTTGKSQMLMFFILPVYNVLQVSVSVNNVFNVLQTNISHGNVLQCFASEHFSQQCLQCFTMFASGRFS